MGLNIPDKLFAGSVNAVQALGAGRRIHNELDRPGQKTYVTEDLRVAADCALLIGDALHWDGKRGRHEEL